MQLVGYIIKADKRCWSYNSFQCCAYLSDIEHAEVFASENSATKWMNKYNIYGEIVELLSYDTPHLQPKGI